MQVRINGEPRQIDQGTTLAQLVRQLEFDPRHIAVERNLELVPRTQHEQTQLSPGDRLEIVTLVGGG